MTATPLQTFTLVSPDETTALAAGFAARLRPGDTLLLEGDLGAGKTHFARGLIQARLAAAGLSEDVPSPSFTLVQCYDDGSAEIWHADLYRLGDTSEIYELGLDEAFETAICLVEWPGRLGADAPQDALTLRIEAPKDAPDTRHVSAHGPERWRPRLAGLADD